MQPPGEATRLDEILALDGLGSISVTPQTLGAEHTQGVDRQAHAANPADEIDSQATNTAKETRNQAQDDVAPLPATRNLASGKTRVEKPAPDDQLQSPSDRLKAVLARQQDRRNPTRSRVHAEQRLPSKSAAPGNPSRQTANISSGAEDRPSVQRLIEPAVVPHEATPHRYDHVKLSDLKQPPGRTDSPAPSAQQRKDPLGNPSLQNQSAMPNQQTQGNALRHLPEGVRGKLNAFVDGAQSSGNPPVIPPPPTDQHAAQPPAADVMPLSSSNGDELKTAILASKRAFLAAGLFSMVINLLMLTGPLFMLQVYDRVMASGSIPTLLVLFGMTALLYAVMGLLELARSRIIVRIGVDVDQRIGDRVFQAALQHSLTSPEASSHTMRELDHLRSFVAGPGPLTFFDAPWTPIYLIVIFALHWTLGVAALIGGTILVGLALLSEYRSRAPLKEANMSAASSLALAETGQRNAETITAMGMLNAYRTRWQNANRQSLAWQVLVADRLGSTSALSKSLRLLMQSTMLAIGAALALQNQISAGTIVAASIIFGRALSPVEQAISQWRPFTRSREAYYRLSELLRKTPAPRQVTGLPAPKGHLTIENLRVAAADTRTLILSNLNFSVEPGQMLAVIGPSASGKSTLARTLVGLWPPFGGAVRIDGARLDRWNQEELGKHIGYLPQSVELFAGTVKDNISRFQENVADEDVVAAARMAHAHDMIIALPQGYDTPLGSFGTYLSGGQRQRIGLARALYGNPSFVVLDEPNANLDRHGDEALDSAIEGMRNRGQTIVLISHRVGALSRADLLLYIDRGVQRAFGPRDDVMKLLQGAATTPSRRQDDSVPTAAQQSSNLKSAGRTTSTDKPVGTAV